MAVGCGSVPVFNCLSVCLSERNRQTSATIVGTVHGSCWTVGDPRFKPLHTVGADDHTDRPQVAERLVRRVTLTAQLLVTAPRTLAAGHCDARKCSRSRSHIDQDLSASTAPVMTTTLTPSFDASATSPASVELDTACRLESCSRLCSHRWYGSHERRDHELSCLWTIERYRKTLLRAAQPLVAALRWPMVRTECARAYY